MKTDVIDIQTIHPPILYFGTPVVLLSTLNSDGTTNLTPLSSAWALGNRIVMGLGFGGQGFANLKRHKECVINLPDASMWSKVERLAPLTAADPIPEYKRSVYRYVKDKFSYAGLTPLSSRQVKPDRVEECPLQIEAVVKAIHPIEIGLEVAIVETEAVHVHAHRSVMLSERHVNPAKWNPLIYNFRHYFGLSEQLGKTFKSET